MGDVVIRQCEWCGADFQARSRSRFCSKSCASRQYWDSRRSERGYRNRTLREHPLADARGVVYTHRAVLYDRIGPGSHPCQWCGITVTWQTYRDGKQTGVLVADHVDGNRQNNDPSNLVPSCFNCNQHRLVRPRKPQTNAVRDDELFVVDKHGWRHRATALTCDTCGAQFIRMTALLKRPGEHRFCSRSCSAVAKGRNRRSRSDRKRLTRVSH
jgi:hypothetical protein